MSDFERLTWAVTCRYNHRINKMCGPLFKHLNINYLYYHEVTDDGYFSCFGSNVEWVEYFGDRKFHLTNPYHRHPKFFNEGVVVLKDIEHENYQQIARSGQSQFNLNFSVQLMNRTARGMGTFGFASNISDGGQISALVNELPLLRLFIKKFREENQTIFSDLMEHSINLGQLLGPLYYEKALPKPPPVSRRRYILEKLGLVRETHFSVREIDVMRLLLEGYSANQIGRRLVLSKRTIEHHIERIKDKLECDSKAELVQKARELEQLGYFGGRSVGF